MFGEPGSDFVQSWLNLIIYAAVLFSVIWVGIKLIETKTGRKLEKSVNKVKNRYENLPFNFRNVVGWLAITFYCVGIIALFIFLEG